MHKLYDRAEHSEITSYNRALKGIVVYKDGVVNEPPDSGTAMTVTP
jgi:hypothetical protein